MSKSTENQTISPKPYHEGFWKGYNMLRKKDARKARQELIEVLKVKNKMSFSYYLRGVTEPKASQAQAIEAIFLKYGVTDVWGVKEA